jgi:acyl-CoA reductase-like NAD-dependent aldehyde dehydrogenase
VAIVHLFLTFSKEEAIRLAHDTENGLAGKCLRLYAQDLSKAKRAAAGRVRYGEVGINCWALEKMNV